MSVAAHFDFDSGEYHRASLGAWRVSRLRRWIPVISIGIPLIAAALIVRNAGGRVTLISALLNVLPWALLGLFYALLVPMMLKSAASKAAGNDPSLRGPQTRTVDGAGLLVQGAGLSQRFNWGDMPRIVENAEFFLFFFNSRVAHYVPKRTLTEAQHREVRDLLAAHAADRFTASV